MKIIFINYHADVATAYQTSDQKSANFVEATTIAILISTQTQCCVQFKVVHDIDFLFFQFFFFHFDAIETNFDRIY